MEYYLTPSAKRYYPTPIDQSLWIVDNRAMTKLNCLFSDRVWGHFCNQSEQLDVPVIFITNDDLGKNVPKEALTHT